MGRGRTTQHANNCRRRSQRTPTSMALLHHRRISRYFFLNFFWDTYRDLTSGVIKTVEQLGLSVIGLSVYQRDVVRCDAVKSCHVCECHGSKRSASVSNDGQCRLRGSTASMIRTVVIGGQGSPELGRLHNHDRVPQTQCPHSLFRTRQGCRRPGQDSSQAGNCIIVGVFFLVIFDGFTRSER